MINSQPKSFDSKVSAANSKAEIKEIFDDEIERLLRLQRSSSYAALTTKERTVIDNEIFWLRLSAPKPCGGFKFNL